MAKAVRAANCVAATAPHGSTASCLFHLPCLAEPCVTPNCCCSHPLARWCLSNLPRCFLWSLGHSLSFGSLDPPWHVPVVGPAGGSTLFFSSSAVLLSSSCGTSALWIHLPWGCRTELICSCLWHWRSGEGVDRRAGGGFFHSPFFTLQKISPEITSVSCPGNNDFKADNSSKTWTFPGQFFH